MARIRQTRPAALKKILRDARPMQEEFIVYRGSIAQTGVRGELLLRPHLSLTREWAVFRKKDLVSDPVPVPPAQRAQRERSHEIVEIAVRKGARARHVQEWLYKVGQYDPPRGIEDHFAVASDEEREAISSRVAQLLGRSDTRPPDGVLFHGLISRGPSPAEFTLHPDPGDRRRWAAVRIEDVVDPGALLPVPRDLLPARLHRFALYFVPVRQGAIVRTMWEKERVVSVPPEYEPANGHAESLPRPQPIASMGDCAETRGACGGTITGSGYPCASPGSFCRHYGIFPCSGTCTTVKDWMWNCSCNCC